MTERFEHQNYRDQLAKDLSNIEDHEERRAVLESEKGSRRYKTAEERHGEDRNAFLEEKHMKENERKVREEFQGKTIKEVVQSYPEFAENIKVVQLEGEWGVSLVFEKGIPDIAYLVWDKPSYRGTYGKILLTIPEPRMSDQVIKIKYDAVCGHCNTELRDNRSLLKRFNCPVEEEGRTYEEAQKMRKEWEKTEEAQKYRELCEQKKIEFKKAVQKACTENGIKYLAMGAGELKFGGEDQPEKDWKNWESNYGLLEGVETVGITRFAEIKDLIEESSTGSTGFETYTDYVIKKLLILDGKERKRTPGFEVTIS